MRTSDKDSRDALAGARADELVAREFVRWLKVPGGKRWLDVATGAGMLAAAILELADPAAVVGIAASEEEAARAEHRVNDPRASFRVGRVEDLEVERTSFDAVVSGGTLDSAENPDRVVLELARAARLNGPVAAYVADRSGENPMWSPFWEAARQFDAAGGDRPRMGSKFDRRRLWDLFLDAGLNDVTTRTIEVNVPFREFDEYWLALTDGSGDAPEYVASWPADRLATLREEVRLLASRGSSGEFTLLTHALAVRGAR